MKQLFILTLLTLMILPLSAQKYMTRNGYIGFFSHTPVEDIKADNNQVAGALDAGTGEVVFQVLMKSFHFEKKLMEEHFNENYVESEKFPRSTFEGKISNLDEVEFEKPGKYRVKVDGDLIIHGVTRPISTIGELDIHNEGIDAQSKIIIRPEDYDIEIPRVVRDNISKEIEVTINMNYKKMN